MAPEGKHCLHAYLPATEPYHIWKGVKKGRWVGATLPTGWAGSKRFSLHAPRALKPTWRLLLLRVPAVGGPSCS